MKIKNRNEIHILLKNLTDISPVWNVCIQNISYECLSTEVFSELSVTRLHLPAFSVEPNLIDFAWLPEKRLDVRRTDKSISFTSTSFSGCKRKE